MGAPPKKLKHTKRSEICEQNRGGGGRNGGQDCGGSSELPVFFDLNKVGEKQPLFHCLWYLPLNLQISKNANEISTCAGRNFS